MSQAVAEILTMPGAAMDSEKLSKARDLALDETIREVRVYSRRAKTPEERIAYAEIEAELIETRKRWRTHGLINGQEELGLAAEEARRRC